MQTAVLPPSEAWEIGGHVITGSLSLVWSWISVNESHTYILLFNLKTWVGMEPSTWWVRTWRQKVLADWLLDPELVKERLAVNWLSPWILKSDPSLNTNCQSLSDLRLFSCLQGSVSQSINYTAAKNQLLAVQQDNAHKAFITEPGKKYVFNKC